VLVAGAGSGLLLSPYDDCSEELVDEDDEVGAAVSVGMSVIACPDAARLMAHRTDPRRTPR
jgi:hypothetical protein